MFGKIVTQNTVTTANIPQNTLWDSWIVWDEEDFDTVEEVMEKVKELELGKVFLIQLFKGQAAFQPIPILLLLAKKVIKTS